MNDAAAFARVVRRMAAAWLALVVLLLASYGSSLLHLGVGNAIAGLAIASVKAGLVAWVFMRLDRAPALTRVMAVAGLFALLLLGSLSLADFLPRREEPAAWQPPQQIAPALGSGTPFAEGPGSPLPPRRP
jgi:cytochrome c oxidase subunit 4